MKKQDRLVLHNLIIKDGGLYAAICLELDVASQGETAEEAEANIKEAVELYLEDVYESGDEKDFIPRPAPPELWLKYFKAEQKKIMRQLKAEEKKLRRQLKAELEPNLQFEIALA